MSKVKKQVREFVVENFLFGEGEEELRDDDSFLEKGVIDSTGVLELVEWIEETFNFKVEDEELVPENLDSINNLEKFIMQKSNFAK